MFIVLEGPDKVGKSTQALILKQQLLLNEKLKLSSTDIIVTSIPVKEEKEKLLFQQSLFFQDKDEIIKIDAIVNDENLWMSLDSIAKLFKTSSGKIFVLLYDILGAQSSVEKKLYDYFSLDDGKNDSNKIRHYALSVVVMVGFCIDSDKADAFDKWAKKIVQEYNKHFAYLKHNRITPQLREMLKNPNLNQLTKALIYSIIRLEHVNSVIVPALLQKKIVICDRFIESTLVYQILLQPPNTTDIMDLYIKDTLQDLSVMVDKANLRELSMYCKNEISHHIRLIKDMVDCLMTNINYKTDIETLDLLLYDILKIDKTAKKLPDIFKNTLYLFYIFNSIDIRISGCLADITFILDSPTPLEPLDPNDPYEKNEELFQMTRKAYQFTCQLNKKNCTPIPVRKLEETTKLILNTVLQKIDIKNKLKKM